MPNHVALSKEKVEALLLKRPNLKEELMMIASQLTPEIGLNPQFMNFQRELMKNVDLLIGDIQKTRKFFLDSSVLAKQYGLRDISELPQLLKEKLNEIDEIQEEVVRFRKVVAKYKQKLEKILNN